MMGGNPRATLQQLMYDSIQRDPATLQKFQEFVQANQGRSVEQLAREGGIDFAEMRRLLG